ARSAKDLHERMKAAGGRLVTLEAKLDGLLRVRTENMKELRRYLRVVIDELHLVLPPMDPRWELFGLNRPGSKETPDVPEDVAVAVIDNKRGNVTWPRSARAEYYRVWLRIEGVDAEPRVIGSPSDLDFMLEELPATGEMDVFVSAINSGGESALSAPVRIVLAPLT
ncbi:MAG: hypothetical protein JWM68_2867, partial [Verrucomicrobiales bacterium]|nr:hypothetical protein [Verrucomicrobiales bacterium]